jgi:hypothetical protein
MSEAKKVVKSSGPTLPHLVQNEKTPQGLNLPPISLSKETREQLEVISKQMQDASQEVAESESVALKQDETKILDPEFSSMNIPPDLSIASVAARKKIESKLLPLRIDDLFISGEIQQSVEVVEGKLKVVYRTLRSNEDLYIKKKLSEVKTEVYRYAEDRMLLMYIAAHLVEVNGSKFVDLSDANGKIVDKNFDARFQQVSNLPQILIERIWVNLRWFEDRVRKALSPDFLENG